MTQLRNVGGSPFWSWYGFGSRCCFLLSRSGVLAYTGLKVETNTEYTPQGLEMILGRYTFQCRIDEKAFVHCMGHRKTREQRYYEKLKEYTEKLIEYVKKIRICGPERNSYSKADHDATFMRNKGEVYAFLGK